jgi:ribosomal protein L13E
MSMPSQRKVKKKEPPIAFVLSRHDGGMIKREARGFSLSELKEAGLSFSSARRLGILVDRRRRSKVDDNVKALKDYSKPKRRTSKRAKKAQSSERESK